MSMVYLYDKIGNTYAHCAICAYGGTRDRRVLSNHTNETFDPFTHYTLVSDEFKSVTPFRYQRLHSLAIFFYKIFWSAAKTERWSLRI